MGERKGLFFVFVMILAFSIDWIILVTICDIGVRLLLREEAVFRNMRTPFVILLKMRPIGNWVLNRFIVNFG
jgi:hypothetical protein